MHKAISWESESIKEVNISTDPQEPETIKYLYIEGATYMSPTVLIPYFAERIKVEDGYDYSVLLTNNTFSVLEAGTAKVLTSIESIESEIVLSYHVYKDRGVPYLYYQLPLLRKNTSSGSIEKLTGFSLHIEAERKAGVKSGKPKSAANSVLSSGFWYKIAIKEDGIYKLTHEQLAGLGFDNLANIKVFGNCGGLLPYNNNEFRYSGLQENGIYMEKGADGVFNGGDYILFYGQGPHIWKYDRANELFTHVLHRYSDYCYYF
ncbi:MAG: hypothetical protein HC896_14295 [Bacteroidales bacterium]|nr:hypothetical protein [Bacteroidales bacterium]